MTRSTVTAFAQGKLFIVGEDHGESKGARRLYEKLYCEEVVGGDYWTELTFPSRKNGVVKPEKRGDSNKLRAVDGTVRIISALRYLNWFANHISDLGEPKDVAAKILDLYKERIPMFAQSIADHSDRLRWKPESRGEVATAEPWRKVDDDLRRLRDYLVEAVAAGKAAAEAAAFTPDTTFKARSAMRHQAIIDMHKVVAKHIADTFTDVLGRMPAVLTAAEIRHDVQADAEQEVEELAKNLMVARSRRMLRAAKNSGLTGVWKVGDRHIEDIIDEGKITDEPGHVAIMTMNDFNVLFRRWLMEWYQTETPWTRTTTPSTSTAPTSGY